MAIPNKDPGVIYAPNSIHHGHEIFGRLPLSDVAILNIEIGRLDDFIEFLFEHSEHCDHISQSDAWKEFAIYEAKHSFYRETIRKKRELKKLNPIKQ